MGTLLFSAVWLLLGVVLWIKLRLITAELIVREASITSARGGTAAVLLLLAAPIVLLSPFWRLAGLLVANAALTSLALADALYFRYYGDVLAVSSLTEIRQFRRMQPSLRPLLRRTDLLLALDVVCGLLLLPWALGQPAEDFGNRFALCGMFAVAGIVVAIPTVRLIVADPDGRFAYVFQRREIVTAIGLIPYHVYDSLAQWRHASARTGIGEASVKSAERALAKRRTVDPDRKHFAAARGMNIILVSAESLQRFVIGLEVDGNQVAPNLTAFSREALNFTRFYDQTHLGTTADAEWTSLHSLHPLARGAVASRCSGHAFRALPAILSDHGYAAFSACAAPASFWNMGNMHARLGIEQSAFLSDYSPGEWIGTGIADQKFFEQSVPKLASLDGPFFSFLITCSVHWPFKLPDAHRTFDPGRFRDTIAGDYLQSVHYFDGAFGRFLALLRDRDLLDQSLLVVFGDHQAHLTGYPETDDLMAMLGGRFAGGAELPARVWELQHDVPWDPLESTCRHASLSIL